MTIRRGLLLGLLGGMLLALLGFGPVLAGPDAKVTPGPLVVKAFLSPYDPGPTGDPSVRTWLEVENPTRAALKFKEAEAQYLGLDDIIPRQTERLPLTQLGGRESRTFPTLYFANYARLFSVRVRLKFKYTSEGACFEREAVLTNENPAVPAGFSPTP